MKKIGLLGCGAIGSKIALAIDSGNIPANLTHIYDQSKEKSMLLASKLQKPVEITENVGLLASSQVDMIVEAASQNAVRETGLSILQNKKDLMIMSVGSLLDESIFEILTTASKEFNKKIILPSGAIAGLDAIKSAKDELESVILVTTKHPKSLQGAKFFETSKINLESIKTPTTIFEGTAEKAVQLFPANINVAALLSLVGLGSKNTKVMITADPNTDKNTHMIQAMGKFGKISVTVENTPDSDNPKTSRLAILSAIQTLKNYCTDGIRIGT